MLTENITKQIITPDSNERAVLHRIFSGQIYIGDFDTYHPNGGLCRRIQLDLNRYTKSYERRK